MTSGNLSAQKRVMLLKNLPTLPGMVAQLNRAVASDTLSANDVARLIGQDQVLSAKVLKLANSAFFGFSRRVGSLSQAVVLLGFDVVKGLILTSSVFDLMKDQARELWRHSLGVSAACRVVGGQVGLGDPEELGLAGLLHDLGKVVLRVHMTQDMAQVWELVQSESMPVRQAEQRVLGFDHAQVGRWLAEAWRLPEELAEPMHHHHQPGLARRAPLMTAVVHLADLLVRAYGFGDGADVWVPQADREAMKGLGLNADRLEAMVAGVCEELLTLPAGEPW